MLKSHTTQLDPRRVPVSSDFARNAMALSAGLTVRIDNGRKKKGANRQPPLVDG